MSPTDIDYGVRAHVDKLQQVPVPRQVESIIRQQVSCRQTAAGLVLGLTFRRRFMCELDLRRSERAARGDCRPLVSVYALAPGLFTGEIN